MFLRRLFASYKRPYIVGLNNPDRIRVNLAGCELQITLPPHNSLDGSEAKVSPRDIANIYDENLYDKYEAKKSFGQVQFIRRYWNYYGPIWDGPYMAVTDFMATVMRVNCLPEGMSCLNPYHLEQVVMRFLHWPSEMPNFAKKISPVNWRVDYKQGSPWVVCDEYSERNFTDDPSSANFDSFSIAALDDRHVVCLSFGNFGSLPAEDAITACNVMRDKVLSSIHWQLSPELQARKEAVLQKFPNTNISQHRDPEPWVYSTWREGDMKNGEPLYVQIKAGSPAPVFKP